MSVLALAWHSYLKELERFPLRTKAVTAALLAGASDVIAQRLTSRYYNWRRTLTLAAYGLLWSGPSNHYWQGFLERRLFPNKADPLRSLKKVAFDQSTYGPLNNCLLILYVAVMVEGRSLGGALTKLRSLYWAVQLKGWRLWPAAQLCNQQLVPLHLRVLFTNAVSLCWSTFLIMTARAGGLPSVASLKQGL